MSLGEFLFVYAAGVFLLMAFFAFKDPNSERLEDSGCYAIAGLWPLALGLGVASLPFLGGYYLGRYFHRKLKRSNGE